MIALPVRRCSTKDKDQRPERQQRVMEAWAERHAVALLSGETDEGLSADSLSPFERPGFLRAMQRAEEIAKANGAPVAMLHEMVDRFTRRDLDELGWAKTEVKRRTEGRVVVWFCEVGGPEEQDKPMARLMAGFKAESAKDENDRRKTRIPGAMADAKARGVHVGRPSKLDSISEDEMVQMRAWLAEGHGEEKIAVLLNARREVHLLTDAGDRAARSVSAWVVRRALGRSVKDYPAQGNANPKEIEIGQATVVPQGKEILSSELGGSS